jgi:hypothetical protein
MPQSNTSFALLSLGQWCRNHGIYEVRDVLAKAAHLAEGAESSELMALALEEAAIAADVPVYPAPAPKPAAEPQAEEQEPPAKGKRRARIDAGKFCADDPATPEVNEAWKDGVVQSDTAEKA